MMELPRRHSTPLEGAGSHPFDHGRCLARPPFSWPAPRPAVTARAPPALSSKGRPWVADPAGAGLPVAPSGSLPAIIAPKGPGDRAGILWNGGRGGRGTATGNSAGFRKHMFF